MAKFVQLSGSKDWLYWDGTKMYLENIKGGWYPIKEDTPEWLDATIEEYDNWYELCKAKHYYPTQCSHTNCDCWLSPDGRFFDGNAHACEAEYLCEYLYNHEVTIMTCDDYLIEHGWVKLTTSLMYNIYEENGMYRFITPEQRESIRLWCDAHERLYPWTD